MLQGTDERMYVCVCVILSMFLLFTSHLLLNAAGCSTFSLNRGTARRILL